MTRIALLSMVLVTFAASAQVYKWVDEKGVSHYSETPPPDGNAAKIELKSPTGNPPPAPQTDWKQKDLDAREKRIEKEQQAKQREAQEKIDASARRNNCRATRRRLDDLETPGAIFERNDKGEKVYIDDAQREREIAVLQANAQKFCD